jgi:hypothetical protein
MLPTSRNVLQRENGQDCVTKKGKSYFLPQPANTNTRGAQHKTDINKQ